MAAHPRLAVFLGLLAVLPVAGAESAPDKLTGLLQASPFGPPPARKPAENPAGEPFEFRGVLEEQGARFFSIYDPAARRSAWVDPTTPVNGIAVKEYDAAHERVVVEYQGKSLSLSFKRAALALNSLRSPAGGAIPPDVAAPAEPSEDDPRARAAETVRARLREQAMLQRMARP